MILHEILSILENIGVSRVGGGDPLEATYDEEQDKCSPRRRGVIPIGSDSSHLSPCVPHVGGRDPKG